jgi:hypothetical protein
MSSSGDHYKQEILDYDTMLKSPNGRGVLKSLLHDTGVFQSTFSPDNQLLGAYGEGRRSVGLGLIDTLKAANIEKYYLLLKEIDQDG